METPRDWVRSFITAKMVSVEILDANHELEQVCYLCRAIASSLAFLKVDIVRLQRIAV
jgi:hypothetical protein